MTPVRNLSLSLSPSLSKLLGVMAALVLLVGIAVPREGVGQWHQPFSGQHTNSTANEHEERVGIGAHQGDTPPQRNLHLYGALKLDVKGPFGMRYRRVTPEKSFCDPLWDILSNQNERCVPVTLDGMSEERIRLTTYYMDGAMPDRILPVLDLQIVDRTTPFVGIMEQFAGSLLSVKGNLAVGQNYSPLGAPENGAIIEGAVGIGTVNPAGAQLNVVTPSAGVHVNSNGATATNPGAVRVVGGSTLTGQSVAPQAGDGLVVSNISSGAFGPGLNFYTRGTTPSVATAGIAAQVRGVHRTRGISLLGISDSFNIPNNQNVGILADLWSQSESNLGAIFNVVNGNENEGLRINVGCCGAQSPLPPGVIPVIASENTGITLNVNGATSSTIGMRVNLQNITGSQNIGTTPNVGVWINHQGTPVDPNNPPTTSGNNWSIFSNTRALINTVSIPSDRNIKKEIKDYNTKLEDFMRIKAVTYQYDNSRLPEMDLAPGLHYGFISQEIEKVYPNLVTNAPTPKRINDSTRVLSNDATIKALNLTEMLPILWSVVQQQQRQIAELKEKLESSPINGKQQERESVEQENRSSLKIIPNPTDGRFQIMFTDVQSSGATYELHITRASGQVIMSTEIMGGILKSLDLKSFGRGAYHLTVARQGSVEKTGIVIVR